MQKNVLRIGTTGTETPFLPENELPECARLSTTSEDEIMQNSAEDAEAKAIQQAIEQSKLEAGKSN